MPILVATPDAALAALAAFFASPPADALPAKRLQGGQPVSVDYVSLERAVEAGATQLEAAAAANISYATFKRRLHDDERFAAIWAARPASAKAPPFSGEQIRDLAAAGFDKSASAYRLGMSVYKLQYHLKANHALARAWAEGRAAFLIRAYQ